MGIEVINWLATHSFSVIPGNCITCGETTGRHLDLCRDCESDLPWLENCCTVCSLPIDPLDNICLSCRLTPPPYARAICPFRYDFPVDSLISRFKNGRHLASGKILSYLLGQEIKNLMDDLPPAILVPTPLHYKKRRLRGYNQAEEIALTVAELTSLPIDGKSLSRTRDTDDQKSLGIRERQRNVKGAFSCSSDLGGQHVMLVDDVITTGATINEMSRCLLQHGAEEVTVVALARTPPAA